MTVEACCSFCRDHALLDPVGLSDMPDLEKLLWIAPWKLSRSQRIVLGTLLPLGRLVVYADVAYALWGEASLQRWNARMDALKPIIFRTREDLALTRWTIQTVHNVGLRLAPRRSELVVYDRVLRADMFGSPGGAHKHWDAQARDSLGRWQRAS